jgi:hypothetical protein
MSPKPAQLDAVTAMGAEFAGRYGASQNDEVAASIGAAAANSLRPTSLLNKQCACSVRSHRRPDGRKELRKRSKVRGPPTGSDLRKS